MKKTEREKDNEVQIDDNLNDLNLDMNFNNQNNNDDPPTYDEIMGNCLIE